MKFRYFLRGLGVGIVFATIVCLTANQSDVHSEMSKEEIMAKAKEYGMIEPNDVVGDLLEKNQEKPINNKEEKDSPKEDSEQASENPELKNTTKEREEKEHSSEVTTKKNKKTTEDKAREDKTTEEKTTEDNTTKEQEKKDVKITVERGSSSFPVCQRLQELGMITNAEEFDTYLIENGYASRIRVGEHILKIGMSYAEIAEAISDPL